MTVPSIGGFKARFFLPHKKKERYFFTVSLLVQVENINFSNLLLVLAHTIHFSACIGGSQGK
jgi:hypothetical protein